MSDNVILVILSNGQGASWHYTGPSERNACILGEEKIRDWMMQGMGVGIEVMVSDLDQAERIRAYLYDVGTEIQTWPEEHKPSARLSLR